jgi:hypothetical protein
VGLLIRSLVGMPAYRRGLHLAGSVASNGDNSQAVIDKYGNITDHCLTTPTPEYGFKVK